MVSMQHSALITSRETGIVYELGSRIRLASGRNSRRSAEYEQIRSRVTRSDHSALHQVDTLGSISRAANATVAASVAS